MFEVPCSKCGKLMTYLGTADFGGCGGFSYHRCDNTECPSHYWSQDNVGAIPTGLLEEVTQDVVAEALDREDV